MHRSKRKRNLIIFSLVGVLFCMVAGYAAFNTKINIKVKGNVEELTVEDYIQDNLFLHLDGIENTKQGHNQNAISWENLVDNGYDLIMLGFSNLGWTNDNGLYFDGVDDYIDSGFSQSVLGNDITIDIVASPQEINNYRGLVGYHSDGIWQGFAIQFNDNRLLWYYYGNNASCGSNISLEQTQNLIGKNNEITAVMSANNYISIYINGKEITRNNCTIPFSYWQANNLMIARTLPIADRFFKGTIYNYKIYRKALTEEEINQNYKVNKQRYKIE